MVASPLLLLAREFNAFRAGHVDRVQGVRHRRQVFARKVQIDDRVFKLAMTQQHLDGAQIRAGFEQMRGVAVAERVRRDMLGDPRALRCRETDISSASSSARRHGGSRAVSR